MTTMVFSHASLIPMDAGASASVDDSEPDDIVVFLLGQLLNDVETRALSNS